MELAITMSLLLAAVLSVVQVGLWFHTRHVAQAAAQEGLRIARAYDGDETAAREIVEANLDDLAPTLLRDRAVDVRRDGENAAVAVHGTATSILGVFKLTVTERAQGPVERFVPMGGAAR